MISTLLIAFNLFFPAKELHSYYVSISEMEYNKAEKKVEVSIQLTGHDLEYAVNQLTVSKVNFLPICTNKSDSTLILTENYLAGKFQLQTKKGIIFPKVLGIENKNDGNAFVYVVFENLKSMKSVTIKNTVLMDHFSGQQNILHFKMGEQKKTRTFTNDLRTHRIEFKK